MSPAAIVRARAAARVRGHLVRLGVAEREIDFVVHDVEAIPLAGTPTTPGSSWMTTNGEDPGLSPSTFVFARYEGETRQQAEDSRKGYGEPADGVRWASVAEYRLKRAA